MSQDSNLGPAPEPSTEPAEPNPGGVDAVTFAHGAEAQVEEGDLPAPAMRDLDPDSNPAVDDVLPDEMKEGEDTTTSATKSSDGETDEADEKEESPA